MGLSPEIAAELHRACDALGRDAAEIRDLLDSDEAALALEVLIDQYDALGLPLPPALQPFGAIVQLRSDVEELEELLQSEGVDAFDSAIVAAITELDAALGGELDRARSAAEILLDRFGKDTPPTLEAVVQRVLEAARELRAGRA